MYILRSNYFYGNEVSDYGKQHGYVDYYTLSKAFDAVMANGLMETTNAHNIGYWEPASHMTEEYYEDTEGNIYAPDEAEERIEELRNRLDEIDEESEEYQRTEEEIDSLEHTHYHEIFQWFIVNDNGARILDEAGEIVYYNEELDIYLWGVTHWGTSWDYVLTNIKIESEV